MAYIISVVAGVIIGGAGMRIYANYRINKNLDKIDEAIGKEVINR
jgi:hypothetical protein